MIRPSISSFYDDIFDVSDFPIVLPIEGPLVVPKYLPFDKDQLT